MVGLLIKQAPSGIFSRYVAEILRMICYSKFLNGCPRFTVIEVPLNVKLFNVIILLLWKFFTLFWIAPEVLHQIVPSV